MATMTIPALIGQTIQCVRRMTKKEATRQGWASYGGREELPIVIELTSGTLLFPSRDPEGNGAGCLFGELGGAGFHVQAEK